MPQIYKKIENVVVSSNKTTIQNIKQNQQRNNQVPVQYCTH